MSDIQLLTNMHPLICPVTSHRCNPVTHIRNNFLLYLSIFIYFFVWDWAIFIILRKSKPKSGLFSWILENRAMYKNKPYYKAVYSSTYLTKESVCSIFYYISFLGGIRNE